MRWWWMMGLAVLVIGCEPAAGTGVGTAGGLEIAEVVGENCGNGDSVILGVVNPEAVLNWSVCEALGPETQCWINSKAEIALNTNGELVAFCDGLAADFGDVHLRYIANYESGSSDSAR